MHFGTFYYIFHYFFFLRKRRIQAERKCFLCQQSYCQPHILQTPRIMLVPQDVWLIFKLQRVIFHKCSNIWGSLPQSSPIISGWKVRCLSRYRLLRCWQCLTSAYSWEEKTVTLHIPSLFPYLTVSLPYKLLASSSSSLLYPVSHSLSFSHATFSPSVTLSTSSPFHPAVFPEDSISCPTLSSCSVSALLSPHPLPLSHPFSPFWLTPTLTHTCPPAPVALLLPPPLSSCPHCLPLLCWLIHGLRKTLLWQCNCPGSKHTFLLQRICLCSTHTTSQAWVLHIHQCICSLKLEIWNLNCMLSNGAKMLPWWNNKRKDQW